MESTTIHHIVPVRSDIDESNFSFYCGFSNEVMRELRWVLDVLQSFPLDVADIYFTNERTATLKAYGVQYDISFVREDLLDDVAAHGIPGFIVVWSIERTYESSINFINKLSIEPAHISTYQDTRSTNIKDLNKDTIEKLITDMVDKKIKNQPESEFKKYLVHLSESKGTDVTINSEMIEFGHNINRPNISLLKNYGYQFSSFEPLSTSELKVHVESMLQYVAEIDAIRARLPISPKSFRYDGILYCPSMYVHLYKHNSNLWNQILRTVERRYRNFIVNAIVRIKGFSGFEIKQSGFVDPREDETVSFLLSQRVQELDFLTALISIYSSANFCPAIRLPHELMLQHSKLNEIAYLSSKSDKKSKNLLQKRYKTYDKTLKDILGSDFLNILFGNRYKLSCICDFPIEWIRYESIPLMFSHEVSRLGSTPGNLLVQTVLQGISIGISYEMLTSILIVRSFSHDDPIREHIEQAVNVFSNGAGFNNVTLNYKDVASFDELIDALNTFSGSIVIFDCHGGHGGTSEHAWLQIGGDRVDVWELANIARIPPIVITSACMSHPIDGSHASVATGFIRCGALSVLGTFLPLQSHEAAIFVARLLYRIDAFVPLAIKNSKDGVTWRYIVTGFLRMSFITDILRGLLIEDRLLTDEQFKEIHLKSNTLINLDTETWYEDIIADLKDVINNKGLSIENHILQKYSFVETMAYVHIGKPENIHIRIK